MSVGRQKMCPLQIASRIWFLEFNSQITKDENHLLDRDFRIGQMVSPCYAYTKRGDLVSWLYERNFRLLHVTKLILSLFLNV